MATPTVEVARSPSLLPLDAPVRKEVDTNDDQHGADERACPECGKTVNASILNYHVKNAHRTTPRVPIGSAISTKALSMVPTPAVIESQSVATSGPDDEGKVFCQKCDALVDFHSFQYHTIHAHADVPTRPVNSISRATARSDAPRVEDEQLPAAFYPHVYAASPSLRRDSGLLDEARRAAKRAMFIGSLWLLAAVAITLGTYVSAKPGEHYYIFAGAMFFGFWRFLRGVYYVIKPEALLAKT